jgi:A-macroglobulin TED domain/Alpha-2-macroglobulin family/MG2 domain/A-macroglobulin receptor binding domain/Macroglobulin domain MG3/Alpha-2-macroglobulin bait region domain
MSQTNDHITPERADAYHHGLLEPVDAGRMAQHCTECDACRAILDQGLSRRAALAALPPCEPSEELIRSTVRNVEDHENRRRRLRRRLFLIMGSMAAAATLLLGCFHLYYLNLSPTPADLHVYGQTELFAATPASVRVRLMDRKTGGPLAGVPVVVKLSDSKEGWETELASFTTDEQGSGEPRFELPGWPAGPYELCVTASTSDEPEVITRQVRLRQPAKLMLATDKPVYQPGQTIHVRALGLRRPALRPLAGEGMTFTVRDPKDNVIFKRSLTTSRYGIAAVDCPLADELIEGGYTVVGTVGEIESRLTVDVHRYVLPKFRITLKPDRPYYQPGEQVRVDLEARYVFGEPVVGATARITARLLDSSDQLHAAEVKTDTSGKARAEFSLPREMSVLERDSGFARLGIAVQLTDTAGQRQEAAVASLVTSSPLRVEIIPESGTLVKGIANRIYFHVSSPDSKPARATLTIPELHREVETSDVGVAMLEFTPTEDSVRLSARARDRAGLTGWRSVSLTCGEQGRDFLLRTDRAVYNGGDTLKLEILGGGKEPVFLDILRDGQTVLTRVLELENGRGQLQLDLPPEWFGGLQLCAYRIGVDGVPVRKSRALYVCRAAEVKVQARLDHKEYRPGGQAHMTFTLTDRNGKPAPGALSLAAVDEAVFQLRTTGTSLEQSFFLMEQELLRPVYEVYPWTPALKQTVPDDRERGLLEQALFARTASSSEEERTVERKSAEPWTPSPHSLGGDSYPAKEQLAGELRRDGLKRVEAGWLWALAGLLLCGYVLLWILCTGRTIGVVHAIGLSLLLLITAIVAPSAMNGPKASKGTVMLFDSSQSMGIAGAPEGRARVILTNPDIGTPDKVNLKAETHKEEGPARLRKWFPETLLWKPQLITDDQGKATLDFPLADSITTWRLTASAVTADGRLGASREDIRVFQPFFIDLDLPLSLTRNDEVSLRVIVHNHSAQRQSVRLDLKKADWFDLLGGMKQSLEVGPRTVAVLPYPIKVKKAGVHLLELTADAGSFKDRVQKEIEVVPDGDRIEVVHNGTLDQSITVPLTLPKEAIEGSARAVLKVYPSAFSQLVEGLDGIFHKPYGCFEQTSSTTYPNILALDYLKRTGKGNPQVEAKARQYIHLGYQRLLTFEVPGGGFDWYGRPPANVVLTAYGLMEFRDMARVHEVDPRLIERTRQWLLSRRSQDGTWTDQGHFARGGPDPAYGITAYVAWAVFGDEVARSEAGPTRAYLTSLKPGAIRDPYTLALVCNALQAIDPEGTTAGPYLDRLVSLRKTDGKLAWWPQGERAQTLFFGMGPSGDVETTALATLALLKAKRSSETRPTLAWLVSRKDAHGTWGSTQATVLALQALLAGTKAGGDDRERLVRLSLGKSFSRELRIPADQAEVVQQIDLTPHLQSGQQTLTLSEPTGTQPAWQVSFRYHVPKADTPAPKQDGLSIDLVYDGQEHTVGDTMKVRATVRNKDDRSVSMVMVELPVPVGFTLVSDDLENLVSQGKADRFERKAGKAVLYLRSTGPGEALELQYQLRATRPVKVTVAGARVYAYYDPDNEGRSPATHLTVRARP